MVYVQNIDGVPLMPTKRYGKVRRLLAEGKAKVTKRTPFTIRLLYKTTGKTQPITLGVDAGSETIGFSAATEDTEIFSAEVELRNDIVKLMSARREQRRARRNRKTRYRKCRFLNRRRPEGRLAPSVRQKVDTHITAIRKIHGILPITKTVIETAAFDLQLLKALINGDTLPEGTDYQSGEMLGYNTREYVLFRDGHTCQICRGKSGDKVLEVHHIESRMTGGDAPNNLVTLCKSCHGKLHKGLISLPKTIRRGAKFNDAVFMGIMRWTLYDEIRKRYPNVHMTFGYITKNTRIRNGLQKSHRTDARCITGNPTATPANEYYYIKKARCHNRRTHKSTILKGGCRKLNQAPKYVHGYQLFDKVLYNKEECYIFGRRTSGSFDIRKLDGTKVSAGTSYKKLRLLEKRKSYLTERKRCSSHD